MIIKISPRIMNDGSSTSEHFVSLKPLEGTQGDAGVVKTANAEILENARFDINQQVTQANIGENEKRSLSTVQLQEVLQTLEKRFEKPNSCRPEGVTFLDVKKVLDTEPDRAYGVYFAIKYFDAEIDYVQYIDGENYFTDLRREPNIAKQIAFLDSLVQEDSEFYRRRNEAITRLRMDYPMFPEGAFGRRNGSNPSKLDDKLIQEMTGLKSIPVNDYIKIQRKLSELEWLDRESRVWLEEESKEKLEETPDVPRGSRMPDYVDIDVHVLVADAREHYENFGLRYRV